MKPVRKAVRTFLLNSNKVIIIKYKVVLNFMTDKEKCMI